MVKANFESNAIIKKEQAELIEAFCRNNYLWLETVPQNYHYLTRGGEAKIFLCNTGRTVIKLNDGVYYATWLEFLNSILLHNIIFNDTSYNLLGFTKEDNELYAVIEQNFVIATAQADLSDIKKVLKYNGFENSRRNDYVNKELGLILEDMHDENVLSSSESLFFIDSVFYTISQTHF